MSDSSRSTAAAVRAVAVTRVSSGRATRGEDAATVEEPLEIRLHGHPFAVVMRTPGEDRELAAGFLFAEGVILDAAELGAVESCRHPDHPDVHNVVNVFVVGGGAGRIDDRLATRRNVVANSSCGMCGRLTIDSLKARAAPLPSGSGMSAELINRLPEALRSRQVVFDRTGGLHAAALVTSSGEVAALAEDIGRHNAVDKVVGRMLLDETLPFRGALVVSGRTSFEIVQKAWLAGVEVICAVSAPSSLAIELADEAGITLVGFARAESFNVYAHPERVLGV
jgi:FdhD protein